MIGTQRIVFNSERCKGCGLCVSHCPRGSITLGERLNTNGFVTPNFDEQRCTSCGICGWLCPDLAIAVNK